MSQFFVQQKFIGKMFKFTGEKNLKQVVICIPKSHFSHLLSLLLALLLSENLESGFRANGITTRSKPGFKMIAINHERR